MPKTLSKAFFNRPSLTVARELIGKTLVRQRGDSIVRLAITEVEVYDGFRDRASHGWRKETPRNTPMYGPAGTLYVYFTYGMHWMLNIATREAGYPAALLIRGAGDIVGPARLTKALAIDKTLTGKPLSRKSGLWIEEGIRIPGKEVLRTPRIGIKYAGEPWVSKPWRFVWKKEKGS
ncbi:MAG: DNA-3-methyladenine glycosylase [Candidatus Moraniibacteriota bacterium]